MAYTEADLAAAHEHVRAGAQRIRTLRSDIDNAKRVGHPTDLAMRSLAAMLETEALMQAHLQEIERSVTRAQGWASLEQTPS